MISTIVDGYFNRLKSGIDSIDRAAVSAVMRVLSQAWRERRQVFILGNGGSSSTASHMANDLNKLIAPGWPRFRAIALTDNVALITAWANDTSYENIFSEQLANLCQPGDCVIAISCSGNSPNVLAAVAAARQIGATTIGWTGDTGGKLAGMVDVCVRAPAPLIGQQEDVHLILNHMIVSTLANWAARVSRRAGQPRRAVVLAAGEGTRLRPLTINTPKPMLPIAGKPLLAHTLDWLKRWGIEDVAINLHHRPETIVSYFRDGSDRGLRIVYSREDELLGTAGAVRNLADFVGDEPLVVVYGDVLTDFNLNDLLDYHAQCMEKDPTAGVTISLYSVNNPTEVGLVDRDSAGRVTRFVEKPRPEEVFTDLANAGVLVIEPDVVNLIPPGTFYDFGRDLFPRILDIGVTIYSWVVPGTAYLVDIGTPERYAQACRDWQPPDASLWRVPQTEQAVV